MANSSILSNLGSSTYFFKATMRARKVIVLPMLKKQVIHDYGCWTNVATMGTFTKFPVIISIAFGEVNEIKQMASPVVTIR
jgi:hypothetical protein